MMNQILLQLLVGNLLLLLVLGFLYFNYKKWRRLERQVHSLRRRVLSLDHLPVDPQAKESLSSNGDGPSPETTSSNGDGPLQERTVEPLLPRQNLRSHSHDFPEANRSGPESIEGNLMERRVESLGLPRDRRELARNMISQGMRIAEVSRETGLSVSELLLLRKAVEKSPSI